MESKNYNPRLQSPEAQANGGQVKPITYNLVALVGPTASGKSELAVSLAKKFNGEIISCDSRQIYKGLDIGTGKVNGLWKAIHPERSASGVEGSLKKKVNKTFIYKSVPHYCIDFVSPRRRYSVAQFKKQADKAIKDILKRGKLPILCGGTAQYVDAVIFNQVLPEVKPNLKLRAKLEKLSADALFKKLLKLDNARAKNIDRFNKRRLIRALEIVITTGKPVAPLSAFGEGRSEVEKFKTLWIGINPAQEILYKKIEKRLKERLDGGMIKEVSRLLSPPFKGGAGGGYGLSWKKLESFGLEYKFISLYLQKKITYDEMFTQLLFAIKHYSKRQLTWWKRNKEINWIENKTQAEKLVKKFIS